METLNMINTEAEFSLYSRTSACLESLGVCLVCTHYSSDIISHMEQDICREDIYELVDCQVSDDRLTDEQKIVVDIKGRHKPDIANIQLK